MSMQRARTDRVQGDQRIELPTAFQVRLHVESEVATSPEVIDRRPGERLRAIERRQAQLARRLASIDLRMSLSRPVPALGLVGRI